MLIRDVVQQTPIAGYLSIEAEEQLRRLMQTKYEAQDFYAFIKLHCSKPQ